ncbi:MAG TPA: hypothetical protein VGW38_27490, partial [Chloroflexota bacterium]|nr:hypothetical protein [Chloroflexota bacterium]
MKYVVVTGGTELTVEVSQNGAAPRLIAETVDADVRTVRPGLFSVLIGGRSHEVALELLGTEDRTEVLATVDGVTSLLTLEDERRRLLRGLTAGPAAAGQNAAVTVSAPMPGRIVGVPVEVGATVERGQT